LIIDAHAHVIPAGFPAREGWPELRPGSVGSAGAADGTRLLVTRTAEVAVAPPFFDTVARLASMDQAGLDAELVSPLPQLLDFDAPAPAFRDQARHINEAVAAFCAAAPRRVLGLGTVPVQDVDLAIAELDSIRSLGLRGVEVGATVGGTPIGDERFVPFFQRVQELDLPVLVHALPTVSYGLAASCVAPFGMPAQSGLGAASVIGGPVARACPRLRLAFSHGGGGLAMALPRAHFFWGGSRDRQPPVRDTDAPSPLDIARRYYYDALVFDRRALRYLADLVGHTQLVVGSDFPATPREDPVTGTLSSSGLSQPELDDITWHNAFRFLGPAPA